MKESSNRYSFIDYAKSSGIAIPQALSTVILTQPFKNVQISQQINQNLTGKGVITTLCNLGLENSFRGVSASAIKMSVQNMLFNPAILFADRSVTPQFQEENPITSSAVKSLVTTLGKVSLHPVDTFLVHMSRNDTTPKQTAIDMLNKPSFTEKVTSSYRGILPETLKQLVGNGCFFVIKDQIDDVKHNLLNIEKKGDNKLSVIDSIFVGMTSAAIKNAITHPIDLISKTMQDPLNKVDNVKGALNLLSERISKAESKIDAAKIVYRGYTARTMMSAVTLAATAEMLTMMQNEKGKDNNIQR